MRKINFEEKQKIEEFSTAVDDMINGKFILADVKISKILKAIAQSKELYNLLAECMLNFDFDKEFLIAKNSSFSTKQFKMPEENYKKIAFVFCFLVEVDSKNIVFYDFITTYFHTPNSTSAMEYKSFAETMLVPFKEEILANFDLDSPEEFEEQDAFSEEQAEYLSTFDQLIDCINEIKVQLELIVKIKESKRIEINTYLNALIEALKLQNMKIINALLTALNKEIASVKPLKSIYNQFTSLAIKLY